jgi:hypothetical protein
MEGLSGGLSAELGSQGAKAVGITRQQFQSLIEERTHRRRSTTLAELASVAAFVASDRATAMTRTVAN